jgi:polyisoprenoid-binding protein YceI
MQFRPTSFDIGPVNGSILVRTGRRGIGSRAGHDLTIEATRWSGRVEVEAQDPLAGRVEVHVDPGGLRVREGRGGVKPLTDGDRREIEATIAERVLPATESRQLAFHVDRASVGDGRLRLAGELTVGRLTRPTSVEVRLERREDAWHASGVLQIRQTDFGIKPFTGFMGALKVADEVEVEFDVRIPAEAVAS